MKKRLLALLLGTVIAATPTRSLAVSSKDQTNLFYIMSALSLTADTINLVEQLGTILMFSFDPVTYAIDAIEYAIYRKRRTYWSGVPDELQEVAIQISGDGEEEDTEVENAQTDVHIMALTTTGIEALYDGEAVPEEHKKAGYAVSSEMAEYIRKQFGTPHVGEDISGASAPTTGVVAGVSSVDLGSIASTISQLTGGTIDLGSLGTDSTGTGQTTTDQTATGGTDSTTSTLTETEQLQEDAREKIGWTDADQQIYRERRRLHKQKTALTGVTKAELFQSASATDNSEARIEQLKSYVGKGESLVAQVKIMAGLELELAGRLNTLNAVQANTLAVDAAAALEYVR